MEAWLAHRGLGTLDLRLARQAANAEALARGAARAPGRRDVAVAGPPDDPAHDRRRRADAPVERRAAVHAALASEAAVGRFLAASRLTASATSFGGLRSTADRRQRWGDAVAARPRPLLRRLRGRRRPRGRRRAALDAVETTFGALSHSRNPPGLWSHSRREVVA